MLLHAAPATLGVIAPDASRPGPASPVTSSPGPGLCPVGHRM